MYAQSTVPTDIIFQILCHSNPRDIIRWRSVSKMFNTVTRHAALWKTLYKVSPFPRPPGPFLAQSVTLLERTLLKAARLAESWTTRPMRALSSLAIDINEGDELPVPLKLIFGRWLVVFESRKRFVLHDIDLVASQRTCHVLLEQDTPQEFIWNVESRISPEGHCMVYLLLRFPGGIWRVLEFQLNRDSGEPLHLATIDSPYGWRNLCSRLTYVGDSQLLFMPGGGAGKKALDTRTHVFYTVPLSNEELFTRHMDADWVIFSDTIISLCRIDLKVYVYVFSLLPGEAVGETSPRTLCLTHQGIISGHISNVKPVKPVIDLATGATNIRLLDYSIDHDPLALKCVEMTLPRCSPGVVLPININIRNIKLPRERVRLGRYEIQCKYIDVSDDGQIRGFFRANKREPRSGPRPWDTIENQLIMKFTIDATQDPWVVTRSQITPAEWSPEDDPHADQTREDIFFDGMRGRLCYAHMRDAQERIIVADIE